MHISVATLSDDLRQRKAVRCVLCAATLPEELPELDRLDVFARLTPNSDASLISKVGMDASGCGWKYETDFGLYHLDTHQHYILSCSIVFLAAAVILQLQNVRCSNTFCKDPFAPDRMYNQIW